MPRHELCESVKAAFNAPTCHTSSFVVINTWTCRKRISTRHKHSPNNTIWSFCWLETAISTVPMSVGILCNGRTLIKIKSNLWCLHYTSSGVNAFCVVQYMHEEAILEIFNQELTKGHKSRPESHSQLTKNKIRSVESFSLCDVTHARGKRREGRAGGVCTPIFCSTAKASVHVLFYLHMYSIA